VAIAGFAIPVVLGVQSLCSSSSTLMVDRAEAASAARPLDLYLNGRIRDAKLNTVVPFATVYGWVCTARNAPAKAQVIYGYRTSTTQSDYIFSQTKPDTSVAFDGRLLAVEILAPDVKIIPDILLPKDSASYSKACLPVKVAIHALTSASQSVTGANLVDTYPLVVSR